MPICCDFCRPDSLTFAYAPDGSTRGLKVYVCQHCGLVQSAPRIARTKERHSAAVSGGADWGNVRYGKGVAMNTRSSTKWIRSSSTKPVRR